MARGLDDVDKVMRGLYRIPVDDPIVGSVDQVRRR